MLKMTEAEWWVYDRSLHNHELRCDRLEEGPPSEMTVGLSSYFGTHWSDDGISCRIRSARLDLEINGDNRPHASWQLGSDPVAQVGNASFMAAGTETRPSWDIEVCGDEHEALQGKYATDAQGLMRLRDPCSKTQLVSQVLINLRSDRALKFDGTDAIEGNKKYIVENKTQSPFGKYPNKHGWMRIGELSFKVSGDDE